MIRAIINDLNSIKDRYNRFKISNFKIPNIKKYESGKESAIRTNITGFETTGLYQTSTISCNLPYYTCIIPQKLYKILKDNDYDLQLALVKRDPSIKPTCMFICMILENKNPNIDVIIISDQLAKGFNQDQDGDKNAEYFLKTKHNNYDLKQTFKYKLAKLELGMSFRKKCTLLSSPRYLLSETSLMLLYRHREQLTRESEVFRRTYHYGIKYINEALAGYFSDYYDEFQKKLIELNQNEEPVFISIDDILLETNNLTDIIESRTKGTYEHINMLHTKLKSNTSLFDNTTEMINKYNKYIDSSKSLSIHGRKQFTGLYGSQDLIAFNGLIYLNKIPLVDYTNFSSCGLGIFNAASLDLAVQDLISNYEKSL